MPAVPRQPARPTEPPQTQARLSPADIRSIITGLMLAILLGALDQTVISVSLPQMATDLQGVDLLAWVVSGYLIAMAVATPVYGKLGDIYGRRTVLSSAIVLFLVASFACALAPSMPVLVAARILQGLGGGGLISVAQATIADVVAPRERGRYQAYISGAFAVASVSGPVVGGLLTTHLSWRWVFWINLPLGLLALLVSRRALAKLKKPSVRRKVDYLGAGLLTAGLTGVLLSITLIGRGHAMNNAGTWWLLATTVVALALYGRHALRTAEPIIPLGLFRIRTVTVSCLITFLAFIQLLSMTVLVPLKLQMLAGLDADGAALRLIPFSLSVPLGAYAGGKLMAKIGRYKHIQLTGTLIVPAALMALSLTNAESTVAMSLVLVGVGVGIGLQLPTSTVAVQNAVPHHHMGVSTATVVFCRSLGSAIGISIQMAILMMALGVGAQLAGIELTGADMIKLLIGHGDVGGEMHPLFAHGADTPGGGPGTHEVAALEHIAHEAFSRVHRLAALVALVPIALTMMLADTRLSERTPPTAER